jgi:hypothetical protein
MMKKLLFCALAALALVACDKDDDNNKDGIPANHYEIASGNMYYVVTPGSTETEDIELDLLSTNFSMLFNMHVPLGNDKLVAGTYKYEADNHSDFKIASGGIYKSGEITKWLKVTRGTVKVAVSGETYAINIDCTLEDSTKLTGSYIGKLEWAEMKVDY